MLISRLIKPTSRRDYASCLIVIGVLSVGAALLIKPSDGWNLNRFWAQRPFPYPFTSSLQHENQKTLERSISFYQGRIQQSPDDGLDRASLANLYIQMARATQDDGWYLMAEQSAQKSLANLPFDNDGAILALARIAQVEHDFVEAMRLTDQVAGEEALAIAITAKLAMGHVDEAGADADRLVDLHPSLGSLTLRALTRSARGDNEGALQDFQRAIAIEEPSEPRGSAQVRTLLGRFYFEQGEHALARQLYRDALEIVPNYPLANLHLAELETQLGRYRAAAGYYRQMGDPVALHGIARIKTLQGQDANDAWDVAETALREHIGEDHLGHRRDLAHLLLERGNRVDVPEAIALMEAETMHRRDAETLDIFAWALTRAGRLQEAQQVIQEALDQGVRDAGIAYRAGEIELALNNQNQAEQFFQLAKEINPTFDHHTRQRLGQVVQE